MKKILLVFLIAVFGATAYGQIDSLTAAGTASHRQVRHKINQVITQVNLNKLDIDTLETDIVDTISLASLSPLLSDTMLFVSWTIGSGNVGDTVLFSLNDIIAGIKWEGSHPLVITKVTGVVYGTTPDIDIALLHDANFRDATPTAVLNADLTVTSTTTGSEATAFASATIASGQWLYVRIDQQTAQPRQAIINIYGHLTE